MKQLFMCISDLKIGRSFKLSTFDCLGRSRVSKETYKVIGKLPNMYECIEINTGEKINLPLNQYVSCLVYDN